MPYYGLKTTKLHYTGHMRKIKESMLKTFSRTKPEGKRSIKRLTAR
jgi:hypothetical protein